MAHIERFKEMLTEAGIEYRESDKHYDPYGEGIDDDVQVVELRQFDEGVDGYGDFFSEFIFDSEGQLLRVALWE